MQVVLITVIRTASRAEPRQSDTDVAEPLGFSPAQYHIPVLCIIKVRPPMGGVSYSVAVAGRLPVAQQRGWEGRVLGATRRRTCSAVEAPGTVWPPACRRKSQPQSPLRTSAALCIVSLERDGEGNFCRVGVATGQPREEAVDVSRNVSVCARVSHNNYY